MSKRGLYKLMKRSLLKNLVEWKNSPRRKPLILKGVRQVGKTWLLKEFGRLYYENVAYFNFDENEEDALQRLVDARLAHKVYRSTGPAPRRRQIGSERLVEEPQKVQGALSGSSQTPRAFFSRKPETRRRRLKYPPLHGGSGQSPPRTRPRKIATITS